MTNTHIRGASDIDLLVMCEKFHGTDIYKVREEINKSHLHSPSLLKLPTNICIAMWML